MLFKDKKEWRRQDYVQRLFSELFHIFNTNVIDSLYSYWIFYRQWEFIMEKNDNNLWIIESKLSYSLSFNKFKVKIIQYRKIIQINGAIGHSDSNYNLVMALRNHNVINLWRGCELRLANILLYTLVYSLYFEKNNKWSDKL